MQRKRQMLSLLFTGCLCLALALVGCGSEQASGEDTGSAVVAEVDSETAAEIEEMLAIGDDEQAAVEAARAKVAALDEEPRIIATSPSVAAICDKLNLDLVGVCSTTTSTIPDRYADVTTVGTAMSPDMEIVASLNPDWILSPSSLQSDLQPKYEAIDTDYAFLNMKSVQGMYRSIQELGAIFDREEEAQALVDEFTAFYSEYKDKNSDKESPTVLILMGLPGSYIIATENSYVGSLVALAGGENVYAGTDSEFLTVNTEDMKTKEPDIILCASHALPDQVMEMFEEDFATNDIWQHFEAVQNDRVYYLTYSLFGMSATFDYPEALDELQLILYPENEEDEAAARANSSSAQEEAENSNATEIYSEILNQ